MESTIAHGGMWWRWKESRSTIDAFKL